MPELPEVETVCRGLAKALIGARITAAAAHRKDLRLPMPKNLAANITGRTIVNVKRRAKYILIALDNNQTLLLHLGMSGRLVLSQDDLPLRKHDHISLSFNNGMHARFNDPRRFGICDLVPTDEIQKHKLLRHLGIEPLGGDLTASRLVALLGGRKTSIKIALLDQRLVVGIGNIYASEALFHASINPKRFAGSIKYGEIKKLVPAIRKVLNAAIKAGGSSLRDYVRADGELGYFQHHFAVYDRTGLKCPGCICDISKTKGIHRITQGARSTFYCATKQK